MWGNPARSLHGARGAIPLGAVATRWRSRKRTLRQSGDASRPSARLAAGPGLPDLTSLVCPCPFSAHPNLLNDGKASIQKPEIHPDGRLGSGQRRSFVCSCSVVTVPLRSVVANAIAKQLRDALKRHAGSGAPVFTRALAPSAPWQPSCAFPHHSPKPGRSSQ